MERIAAPTADPEPVVAGLQGRLDRDSWFIKARGSVNSESYGTLIHARNLVPVKGLGTRYSGNYLVSSVASTLADGHFEQQIELNQRTE